MHREVFVGTAEASNEVIYKVWMALSAAFRRWRCVYYGSIPIRHFSALTHPCLAPAFDPNKIVGLAVDIDVFSTILWVILPLQDPFSIIMIHKYEDTF
jgi:hypothetical protein